MFIESKRVSMLANLVSRVLLFLFQWLRPRMFVEPLVTMTMTNIAPLSTHDKGKIVPIGSTRKHKLVDLDA